MQNITGFWRRFFAMILDSLIEITIIGFIFHVVFFIIGKPFVGMRVCNYKFQNGARNIPLLIFRILSLLLYGLTIGIFAIIDLIRVITKKGTFAEKWSGNYYVNN